MKNIFIILLITVAATAAQSQTANVAAPDFRTQVQQEIARYKNGQALYRHCDVFTRIINDRVATRLKANSKSGEGMMSVLADTSSENDISLDVKDQNETTIAISRKDPRIIVAGANDDNMERLSMPVYASTNGGNSWHTFRLPSIQSDELVAYGDPIITADDSGNFYYAFLVDDPYGSYTNTLSDLIVARSADGINWTLGGQVMGNTTFSSVLEDKETIAIDRNPASPYHGRLYITWNEYNYADTSGLGYSIRHLLAFSDDQAQTWSTPVEYTQTYGYFPLPRTGKNGTLFISSSTEDDTDGINTDGMTVSADGGQTFSENPISDYTLFPTDQYGYPGLKGMDGFRAFPYIAFDVDPSNNMIYAVYGSYDDDNADAMLFAAESSDEGQTWFNVNQIGTPSLLNEDHFLPWVSHDASTNETYISLYSSEEDPSLNVNSRVVRCAFSSTDQMQDIGSRLFNPLEDTLNNWNFIGDYVGSDAYGGYYASAWTENRPPNHSDGDIFAYVSSPLGVNSVQQINSRDFDVGNFMPNPVNGLQTSISISSSESPNTVIQIFDINGRKVETERAEIGSSVGNKVTLDAGKLSAGVYRADISNGRETVSRSFIVLR